MDLAGSTGMLCGACPYRWARDDYPDYCQPCPDEAVSALVVARLNAKPDPSNMAVPRNAVYPQIEILMVCSMMINHHIWGHPI